jgi:hypothetical protein
LEEVQQGNTTGSTIEPQFAVEQDCDVAQRGCCSGACDLGRIIAHAVAVFRDERKTTH